MTHLFTVAPDLTCSRCGRPGEAFDGYGGHFRHARPRCGAVMRHGETCARYAGHAGGNGGGHRSRYGMASWSHKARLPQMEGVHGSAAELP